MSERPAGSGSENESGGSGNSGDLFPRLKQKTWFLHEQLEKSEYGRRLASARPDRLRLINHLKAASIYIACLERNLDRATHPVLTDLRQDYQVKLPVLLKDIRALSDPNEPECYLPVIQRALEAADQVLMAGHSRPLELLGHFYVLEGSFIGAAHFAEQLIQEKYPTPPPEGALNFFQIYKQEADGPGTGLRRLKAHINNLTNSREQAAVLRGARLGYRFWQEIFRELENWNPERLGRHITAINPEAGNHELPLDPRVLEIALNVGEQCWNKFPVLKRKFGERGRRFTLSDSCWLVTLADFPEQVARDQVLWLARMLDPRGVPPYMIQYHLRKLGRELARGLPEKAGHYRKLTRLARELGKEKPAGGSQTGF